MIDSEALHESESNLRNRNRFISYRNQTRNRKPQTFRGRKRNRFRKLFIANIGIGTDTGIGSEVDNRSPFEKTFIF